MKQEVVKRFVRRLRKVGNCHVVTLPPFIVGLILAVNPRGEVEIIVTENGIIITPRPIKQKERG